MKGQFLRLGTRGDTIGAPAGPTLVVMHNRTRVWHRRARSRFRRTRRASVAVALVGLALLGGCSRRGSSSGSASSDGAGSDAAGSASTIGSVAALQVAPVSWKLPQPMSGLVAVAVGDRVLVYSGLDAQRSSLGAVWTIDPSNGATVRSGQLPHRVHDAAGVVIGGHALLLGGGEQERATADVVDVSAAPPEVVGALGVPRSDLAAVTVGDRIVVAGGYDGQQITAPVLVGGGPDSLAPLVDLIDPVRYGAMAAVDDRVYVFGGRVHSASGDHQIDTIQQIDLSSGQVTAVGHLPQPAGHQAAVTIDGAVYLFGGRVGAPTSAPHSSVIWRFDPTTGQVTVAGQLPTAVSDLAAVTSGGTTWLLGGELASDAASAAVLEVRSDD